MINELQLWFLQTLTIGCALATLATGNVGLDRTPQDNPNEFSLVDLKPLTPFYRRDFIFDAPILLGPVIAPSNNLDVEFFLLSVSFLQSNLIDLRNPTALSPVQCRYDALMYTENVNGTPSTFWWEPLQDPIPMDTATSQLFYTHVTHDLCGHLNGANVMTVTQKNSSSIYAHQIAVLVLPLTETASTIQKTSFLMTTATAFLWYPIMVSWNNIPPIWWQYLQSEYLISPQFPTLLSTAWCGSTGYIFLPQLAARSNVTVDRFFVLTINSDLEAWTVSPILATTSSLFEGIPLSLFESIGFPTLWCHGSTVPEAAIYLLHPVTSFIWKLDSIQGWQLVGGITAPSHSSSAVLPPPITIGQSILNPPLICWKQLACMALTLNTTTNALFQPAFNRLSYLVAWLAPNSTENLCIYYSTGELLSTSNFMSTVLSTFSLARYFPRLNYADGLGLTMLDGSSAVAWFSDDTQLGVSPPIMNLADQVYVYVCDNMLSDEDCSVLLNDVVILQFDLTFQTCNILTLIDSASPSMAINQFHGLLQISGALINALSTFPPPLLYSVNSSTPCFIYSLSIAGLSTVDFILSHIAEIWMFCPILRQFYLLGNIDFVNLIALSGEVIVDVEFTSTSQLDQIMCLVSYVNTTNAISTALLLGEITAVQKIQWRLALPCQLPQVWTISPSIDYWETKLVSIPESSQLIEVFMAVYLPSKNITTFPIVVDWVMCSSRTAFDSCNATCTSANVSLMLSDYDTPTITPLMSGMLIIATVFDTVFVLPTFLLLLDVFSGGVQYLPLSSVSTFMWETGAYLPFLNKLIVIESRTTTAGLRKTLSVSLQCPAGYYDPTPLFPAPAAQLCHVCPIGQWNDALGKSSCIACVSPLTTQSTGSTSSFACSVCPASYCHDHGVCIVDGTAPTCECAFGYYPSDRCAVPWLFVVTIVIIIVGTFVTYSIHRFRKVKRDQKQHQSKLMSEISDLKQAWQISWSSLDSMQLLAAGGFGSVYMASWCGRTVAVKVMHDSEVSALTPDFEREARALRQYRHPQIVLFYGVGINTLEQQFIVTEFVQRGSLRDVLENNEIQDQLSWTVRLGMALDIATGVEFLHRQNPPVIHRDLKSPNVLVTANFRCKIGDLGTARLIEISSGEDKKSRKKRWLHLHRRARTSTMMSRHETDAQMQLLPNVDGDRSRDFMSRRVGTTKWAAPEMLRGDTDYGLPVDIYACGIVFWEIVTNELPFEDVLWSWEVAEEVCEGRRPEWPKTHFAVNQDLYIHLAEECWAQLPQLRPRATEVVERMSLIENT